MDEQKSGKNKHADRRINREKRTVEAMVHLYCRHRHQIAQGLCADCRELLTYALQRLDNCPFGEGKTTCVGCKVHCYRPDHRERIREVMRVAGPRMLFRHPILAIRHLLDESKRG
jgi:hypothetical protein